MGTASMGISFKRASDNSGFNGEADKKHFRHLVPVRDNLPQVGEKNRNRHLSGPMKTPLEKLSQYRSVQTVYKCRLCGTEILTDGYCKQCEPVVMAKRIQLGWMS